MNSQTKPFLCWNEGTRFSSVNGFRSSSDVAGTRKRAEEVEKEEEEGEEQEKKLMVVVDGRRGLIRGRAVRNEVVELKRVAKEGLVEKEPVEW